MELEWKFYGKLILQALGLYDTYVYSYVCVPYITPPFLFIWSETSILTPCQKLELIPYKVLCENHG